MDLPAAMPPDGDPAAAAMDLDAELADAFFTQAAEALDAADTAWDPGAHPGDAFADALGVLASADALGATIVARLATGLAEGLAACDDPAKAATLARRGVAVLRARLDEARGGRGYECTGGLLAALAEHGVEVDLGEAAPRPGRRGIGDLLVEFGSARAADVVGALRAQGEGDGRPLGEILLSAGQVDAGDLGDGLARQLALHEAIDDAPEGPEPMRQVPTRAIGKVLEGLETLAAATRLLEHRERGLRFVEEELRRGLGALVEAARFFGHDTAEGLLAHVTREAQAAARRAGRTLTISVEGAADVTLELPLAAALGAPLAELLSRIVEDGAETLSLVASTHPHGRWQLRIARVPNAEDHMMTLAADPAVASLGNVYALDDGDELLLDLPRA
ncbi:MAG: hypothetical protein AAGH15_15040 [Myxococcota bacterium]